VLAACERLPDIGIGHRRTAISTIGWIPGIERLTATPMPIRLALSLHAADEALRTELMPVNERYPLAAWCSSST
jgi:23S rRNA (adenine2503-C2)-methyltransferase